MVEVLVQLRPQQPVLQEVNLQVVAAEAVKVLVMVVLVVLVLLL